MHAEELRAGQCPLTCFQISERDMRTRFVLVCQGLLAAHHARQFGKM
jgi:hypothetical protein